MLETPTLTRTVTQKELFYSNSDKFPYVRMENANGLAFRFHPNGNLYSITKGELIINHSLGCPLAGSLTALYLRDRKTKEFCRINQAPGASSFGLVERGVQWSGQFKDVVFKCILELSQNEDCWKWRVVLKNQSEIHQSFDVFLAQDYGLGHMGAVRTNEAYTSHYLDHVAIDHESIGWTVCSRQTQKQSSGNYPWAVTGCLQSAASYCTDGRDFYGNTYRETQIPEALMEESLSNRVLQYETAMAGLQSRELDLNTGESEEIEFFTSYENNHAQPSGDKDKMLIDKVISHLSDFDAVRASGNAASEENVFLTSQILNGQLLDDDKIRHYYPGKWKQEERADNQLLSFFYKENRHIVLPAKEMLVDRPHAHMLATFGDQLMPNEKAICSTNYMHGLFNAQITCGTKKPPTMLSFVRNPYNLTTSSGQRVFVQIDNEWRLLGMPSFYECGLNHCRWVYCLKDGAVEVKTYAKMGEPKLHMQMISYGKARKFALSHQLVFGGNEYDAEGKVFFTEDQFCFQEVNRSEADYFLKVFSQEKLANVSDASWFGKAEGSYPFLVLETEEVSDFDLGFAGEKFGLGEEAESIEDSQESVNRFYKNNLQNLQFSHEDESLEKFNQITPWYLHNALIHFISPHGIEQYKGGAWGVRDVTQGSIELLMATGHQELVKDVLKIVFSRQLLNRGDWPQWFSPGDVKFLQLHAHGDVIAWPLKALSDYIIATGDIEFLQEKVPFLDEASMELTGELYTIEEHCKVVINEIISRFVGETHLISYGEGDWNDSLQPANQALRERLVSSWTVELVYQTFNSYKSVCDRSGNQGEAERLKILCRLMKEDFNKFLVIDDVVSGFVLFDENLISCEPMLHPKDTKTGIEYRLLPMTRGVISEMFDAEQAANHLEIIEEKLLFPDGAHLMNKPPKYNGGVETYFKRAESGCNFGREIGLQYVHAHIRYAEAMAKLGKPDELLKALYVINPINIGEIVKNAETRQSNLYFSSSDGDFANRYESYEKFDELKSGERKVKGGWRLYSSGPGLYINQLVSSFLGIRWYWDDLILDPVIPKSLDGLEVSMNFCGFDTKFTYHVKNKGFAPEAVRVNGLELSNYSIPDNPYRKGGFKISKESFISLLKNEENSVEILL